MASRLRIAMVAACPFPAGRGTPIRIHRIAEALGRRGHDVHVYTYHLGAESQTSTSVFQTHRIMNIRTYHKESPGPSYQKLLVLDPLLALKLVGAFRKQRFDVIHAHHAEGLLAALPAHWLHGTPLVYDVHTLLRQELPYYRMGLSAGMLRRVGGIIDTCLPGRADQIIAVSEEIRESIAAASDLAPDSIALIPNGVEDAFFAANSQGIRPDPMARPRLVYAGNLAAYQGVEYLIRAFAIARRLQPGLELRIVTESPFDGYEALCRELDVRQDISVERASPRDLPRILASSNVAINPRTHCTGMPQKLLNYMAAGCAIVSFAGSAKHLVHEQTGLVVPGDDVQGLAEAILRLLGDQALSLRLGAHASEFVAAQMSWRRTAERIEHVYERALRQRPVS
jgi:glycosyltransferase involved in cell wall biosynthesis